MTAALGGRVGVVGVGRMGAPIARRLRLAGFDLVAYDTDRSRVDAVDGATSARSPRELAESVDVVVTLLPSSAEVERVFDDATGLLAGARSGQVFVDMGSSHPQSTVALGRRVESKGGALVDAPVSGGVARAETGELAVMVGGDPVVIATVMPILLAVGTTVTRTGPLGSAHAMKALNNLLSATGLAAAVEVLLIGKRYGLEPSAMLEILNASTGMNYSTVNKLAQRVLSRTFDAGFPLALMVKDLEIAGSLAAELDGPLPLTGAAIDEWRRAGEGLDPAVDHTGITLWLEQLCGTTLGE